MYTFRRWYSTVFGTEEQRGGGFARGPAVGQQQAHLQLLGREVGEGVGPRHPHMLARRGELGRRLVSPYDRAELGEDFERRSQLHTRIHSPTGSTQPRTERESGARILELSSVCPC